MKLKKLPYDFSICKVTDISHIDLSADFCFVGKTDEELSLVCREEDAPKEAARRDDGWRAFRVEGELDFSLIGILSAISTALAEARIGLFAISTYNTDYILVKREHFERAMDALRKAGFEAEG